MLREFCKVGDTVFGSWVISRKIGEGSFGKVFELKREDFGETYYAALKVIRIPSDEGELDSVLSEGMTKPQAEQYFYGVVENITHEFSIMSRFKGTANVVSYDDHKVIRHEDGIGWDILIRMELLTPLLTYAYQHPFTRRDIIQLGIDICKALELCQRYNTIHRDIKPENIFVSQNGDFKLGDFGIARTIERTMSGLSKKGTYVYMAPEVYRGGEYGFSVDIYSLGIVLYRLLNRNRLPFLPQPPEPITFSAREEAQARRMAGEPLPPPFYAEDRLAEIVLKACAHSSKDRYSSPAQMRQELEAILYEEGDAALIYPDGDGVSLAENQYATTPSKRSGHLEATGKTLGMFDEQAQERSGSDGTGRTGRIFSVSSTDAERTSSTQKIFSQDKSELTPPKRKTWVYFLSAALCILLVAGGVATYFHLENQKAQELAEQKEHFESLMSEGTSLCESAPERAAELFIEAQGLFPEAVAAYTSYAYALYCAGRYEDCITYIEDTLALGKSYEIVDQSKLGEILGAAYFETGDYAAAASFFRLSTAGGDITVPAMRDYAVSLGRLGGVEMADEILQKMFDAGADDIVTGYVQAEVDYARKDYAAAEAGFKSVMSETEDVVLQKRSLRSLAEVYRDCAALVRIDESPIYAPATKAVEVLTDGIERYGLRFDSTMWEMLGLAYFESFHTDTSVPSDYLVKAAECFNRVVELGVTKDYLYANLYTVYYELKQYDMAEQALQDYESTFPNNYMPHAFRGMMLITIEGEKPQEERDYSAAKEEYEKAGQMIKSSDDSTYYQQLGSLIDQLKSQGWLK